jgi:hypothetical protein
MVPLASCFTLLAWIFGFWGEVCDVLGRRNMPLNVTFGWWTRA